MSPSATKTTKAPRAAKTAKAVAAARFEYNAAQSPYMFVGALSGLDDSGELVQTALGAAVMDPSNVTSSEATNGWALPQELYYSLGSDVSVAQVSEASYKHFKGSVTAFKEACSPGTWALWESLAQSAEESGLLDAIRRARSLSTDRDTRKLVIQDALYFAGLAHDEPGANRIAWSVRDGRARNDKVIAFINDARHSSVAEMREAAAAIATEVCRDAATPKRKRAEDELPHRKMRRANLLTALSDAVGSPVTDNDLTEEERKFVDSGPKKVADIMSKAELMARKRVTVARTATAV